jgi:tetratricopeptide (TPR) repeat protein
LWQNFPELNEVISSLSKYFFAPIIYLFSNCIAFGQKEYQAEIDSLTALTNEINRADTLRAQDYIDLSTYYFRQNIDTVAAICFEGLQFVENSKTDANSQELKSLELSKANLFMNIGFTYYYLNRLDESIQAFYKSLEIAEKYNDKNAIADVRTNIANVQIDLDELASAQENLEISLDIQKSEDDKNGIARTLNTLGYIHRINGEDSLALDHYKEALSIRTETGDRIGMAASFNNIAFIHRLNEDFSLAIENYKKAYSIYEEEDELTGIATLCGNLSNCYLEIGEYGKAIEFAHKGYELSKEQRSTKDLMYLTEVLYKVYRKQGKSKLALDYFEEYVVLKDSATNEKHYKALINQELAYEFAEKEKIIQLEKENEIALNELQHANEIAVSEAKNFRLFFIIIVVSLLLLAGIIFLLVITKQKRTIQKQSKALELVALRSQMNPHFLFNSLNSIKLFIIENEKELSTKYLTKFSKLVRLVLENSNKNLISLEEELEATKYYLELEQIRFKNRFDFEINNDADALIELPPLVLQPYVENSIWHGIMHLDGKGRIEINTKETDEGIVLEIKDNGVGRKKSATLKDDKEQHQSMGLNITQKRIQSLNALFGVNPTIEIIDLEENNQALGTLVKITIPYYG